MTNLSNNLASQKNLIKINYDDLKKALQNDARNLHNAQPAINLQQ